MKYDSETYISRIYAVWLNITQSCNNKCAYCYDAGNDNFNMRQDTLFKIIELIRPLRIKYLVWVGGEPTLHPDFIEFANKCKGLTQGMTLITNGTRVADSDYCRQIDVTPISHVLFSLHGPTEASHDTGTMRKGSFRQILDGIENVRRLKRKVKTLTITTITNRNKAFLTDIVDFSKSLGFKKVLFNACGPTVASIDCDLCVDPAELAGVLENLYLYSKARDIQIEMGTNLPKCVFKPELYAEMVKSKVITSRPCQVLKGTGYQFLSDGSITPCTHLYDLKLFNPVKLNLSSKEFCDKLNSDIIKQQRQALWQYPSIKCKSCKDWGDCVGGCPILWTKFDSDKYLRG